jgi:hypothetical protein
LVMEGYFVQGDAISDKVKSTNQVSWPSIKFL